VGIAILKYRLYGIDTVIRRSVVIGVLAVFITAVYLGIVVGVGSLVGSTRNPTLSIIATAVIAVAFQPIRARARRLADRLVFGKRAVPYEVLSEFSERMAASYSTEDILPRMAQILSEGTGADAEVWLRTADELRRAVSSRGTPAPATLHLMEDTLPAFGDGARAAPVVHQGEMLGALVVRRSAADPLTPTEEQLLADLASQASLVIRNVRLVEDLRASRQRIVAAQDERAKALERNLHDGAQQQLVALAVRLRLATSLVGRDDDKTREMLEQLQQEATDALENLRDLAHGIYPPLLADKGLAAALGSQAAKSSIDVEVDGEGIGRYPPQVEAAVYFCSLEAIQNVAKYANASAASIRLRTEDRVLIFTVEDDGAGFDRSVTPPGAGLTNMADRVAAVGGSLEVRSRPGEGTVVTGRIPVVPSVET
jgi:signal transduction histidine kinase